MPSATTPPASTMDTTTTTTPNPTRIIHLPTPTAYDLWSPTYDHDNNVLQLLDDAYITTHALPLITSLLLTTPSTPPTPLHILDLGCGTGRNILKLLSATHFPAATTLNITGLDASPGMLSIARTRLQPPSEHNHITLNLLHHNILTHPAPPPLIAASTPVVISTLVLEHLPLSEFFSFVSACLPPLPQRGYLVLSNMHPEMGAVSQAGFNIEEEGDGGGKRTKVRAEELYNHQVGEIVQEGRRVAGLEVVGEVVEMGVEERDVVSLGARSRKWVGKKLLVGIVFARGEAATCMDG